MFPVYDDNQAASKPYITWALIAINVIVFLGEVSMPEASLNSFIDTWGAVPAQITHNPDSQSFTTLLTSIFLHGGWSHLIGNMWFLHLFGDNVEDRMGHFKYLVFYLLCGVAASIAQIVSNTNAVLPTVGASGAISGVLGAYVILFPHARIRTYFGWYMSAWVSAYFFIAIWFIMQFTSALGSTALDGVKTGGVAFWAHVGGFTAGVILVWLFAKRNSGSNREYN